MAIDASSSIDDERWALQRGGYREAFRSREVMGAIMRGHHGRIAVTVVQWSIMTCAVQSIEWHLIDDERSSLAFAEQIGSVGRVCSGGTSISGGLMRSWATFKHVPYASERRVIDISGDGRNNDGTIVAFPREAIVRAGIVINGLAIVNDEPDIGAYYEQNVIGGTGSFVKIADGYATFPRMIKAKLLLEIAQR